MKKLGFVLVLVFILVLFTVPSFAAKKTLVINSFESDPAPRATFAKIVELFKKTHPDFKVTVNTISHEDFKTLLRTWLNSPKAPDVVTWFSGERMRYFASKNLIEPIDDILGGGKFEESFPKAFESACTYNNTFYFVPTNWYWWGVYYRKSIFKKYNIQIPKTWDEFLGVCETLKKNGITPIAIGTKYLWTAAGWFDYLDLRVNGLDYHRKVVDGDMPYTDQGMKELFKYWAQLVNKGYFLKDHPSYSWQEAASFFMRGEAAMYLIGQFIRDVAPKNIKSDVDFFRFPVIKKGMGFYEETPIDGFMIPKRAKHKKEAKVFLKFMTTKEAQEIYTETLGRLAANKNVVPPDEHSKKGLNMILHSDGVMQFYDRDTNPEMATAGMNGFVQFMTDPSKIDSILKHLEQERKRIFNK